MGGASASVTAFEKPLRHLHEALLLELGTRPTRDLRCRIYEPGVKPQARGCTEAQVGTSAALLVLSTL